LLQEYNRTSTEAGNCPAMTGVDRRHSRRARNSALCLWLFWREESDMEDAGVGWIAAIIIGGVAGWLAEQFMKSNLGLLMNIVLGIVGAIVANALLGLVGVSLGGWIGYLIAGFIGACILIAIGRMFRR
jgi:uncharacterized membrane protein YeaQ/YmgE (transglycosylase-associated protein family)